MVRWGGEIAPAILGVAVTASDSVDFTDGACEGIYVGGAGNVVVVFPGDNEVTFNSVPAGTILPVRAIRVNSTSTTATNMVALYSRG